MANKDLVNQKTQNIGESISKRFGNNKNLSKAIKVESEKIIRGGEIKSKKDSVKDIENKIAETLGIEVNDEIRVESRRVVEEVKKWEIKNIETVREHRRESVRKEIVEGYRKANPDLTEEQFNSVKSDIEKQAIMVADTYYQGPGIENIQDELMAGETGNEKYKPSAAHSDTEGIIKTLKGTPDKIKKFRSDWQDTKNVLSKLNQPGGVREFTSLDNIMGALRSDEALQRFTNLGQSRVLGWADRINTWTGGSLNKMVTDLGGKFISKIGNESARAFAENSLKLITEKGFQQGFNAILSGGASSAAATAGTAAAGTAAGTAAAGTASAAGTAGAVAGTAAATGATIATAGLVAIVMAALAVLSALKKLGKKMEDGINNLVANGRGEDEDINKLTNKKWFRALLILIFLQVGCTLQNNNVSTLVSPTKDEKADYTGEYSVSVLQEGPNDFKIPTCDPDGKNPNGNNRLILREMALAVVGKITYSGFNVWHQQGASPLWNTPVPQKWVKGKDKFGNSIMVLDMEHEKKRLMYPLYGLDCGGIAKWLWYQCMIDNYNKPNIGDWIYYSKKEMFGLDEVHLESVDDLKIGDVFERTIPESKPMCLKKDKKTGEWYENGCHHFAIYIGKNEKGEPEVIEEVGNGGDPTLTTVTKVTPEYVTIDRDDQWGFKYYHVYRVTDIFKD